MRSLSTRSRIVEKQALQDSELGLETRIDDPDRSLDHASTILNRVVFEQIDFSVSCDRLGQSGSLRAQDLEFGGTGADRDLVLHRTSAKRVEHQIAHRLRPCRELRSQDLLRELD